MRLQIVLKPLMETFLTDRDQGNKYQFLEGTAEVGGFSLTVGSMEGLSTAVNL